jgi:membrane fusion protein (multidrug efflux system)
MFWLLLLPSVAPPAVKYIDVVMPQPITYHNDNTFTGVVEPVAKMEVFPQASGLVERLMVDKPQRVAANTLLVKLEDREAKWQLSKAEAELARALASRKNAPPTQIDQANADVRVAEANLGLAKLQLEQTQVRASRTGWFTPKVTAGQMVQAGKTVLGELEVEGRARLVLNVAEIDYLRYFLPILQGKSPLKGDARRVFVQHRSEVFLPGKIIHIDDRLRGKEPTARVVVELEKTNPLYGPGTSATLHLRQHPGYQSTLSTVRAQYDANFNWRLGLPQSGILVVRDAQGKIQHRTVKPHPESHGSWLQGYILGSGLQPGDWIFVDQKPSSIQAIQKNPVILLDTTTAWNLAPW